MKKILLLSVLLLTVLGIRAQSWVGQAPSERDYSYATVIYLHVSNATTGVWNDTELNQVAAFIDGECRGSATFDASGTSPTGPSGGDLLFTLKVYGDKTADAGKPIALKVYHDGSGNGFEYTLTPSETLTFQGDYTYGVPSSPVTAAVNCASSFTLNFTEAEVGQSYDLKDYLEVKPAEATLPDNLIFSVSIADETRWVDPSPYATVDGSVLTAKAAYQGMVAQVLAPNQVWLAQSQFDIVLYPTAITLTGTKVTVEKSNTQSYELDNFLNNCYTIEPEGATAPAIYWEIDPTADQEVLSWSERGYYIPQKGGITRVRPYFYKRDQTKVVPGNGWVTVEVTVPVTGISIDTGLFGREFKVNVGDTHIFERLSQIITIQPEDATDKSYTLEAGDPNILGVATVGSNYVLTAKTAGTTFLTVSTANGASAVISVVVENPPTAVTLGTNQMSIVLTDNRAQDISSQVKGNVTLNGDPLMWNGCAAVTVTGSSVVADGYNFTSEGLQGFYTAQSAGTTTVTITLTWNDYDSWGVSSDVLLTKTATASFNIVVSEQSTLTGFDVAVTGAVAGQTGTITLTPVPQGATFSPADISVTMYSTLFANYSGWSELLTFSRQSADASAIVYEFSSPVPDVVGVTVTGNGSVYALNDPNAAVAGTFRGFEIGWPLNLNSGWQWRSNPCGFIPQSDFVNVFSTEALTEIRTQDDLLYNDPKWGFYGTLNNTVGLLQDQCYKVKMQQPVSTVLYPSSAVTADVETIALEIGDALQLVLQPGWNWVGNPYFFDRKPSTIFADADLAVGTVIVGKNGSTELGVGGTWQGDLTVLTAGEGYIIKNPGEEELAVNMPLETALGAADETAAGARSLGVKGASVWSYDHSRFMNNMTMVAAMIGLSQPERYTIGAFVGDECRGEGVIDAGMAYITVHCEAGEAVSFRLYDTATGSYGSVKETVTAQTRIGSLSSPFVLHADLSTQGIDDISTASTAATAAYDLSGRSMNSSKRGISIRRNADGTYRKVVMK